MFRTAPRRLLVPTLAVALACGTAAPAAQAAPGKRIVQKSWSMTQGKSADHRPAGVGDGRRMK